MAPTGPGAPVSPLFPGAPPSPFGPVAPPGPRSPAGPASPRGPVGPRRPSGPGRPAGPCEPDSPASPGSPWGPRSPSGPGSPRSPFSPRPPTGPRPPAGPPGSPVGPGGPAGPPGPRSPARPRMPTRPRLPGGPSSPLLPGGPRGPATGFSSSLFLFFVTEAYALPYARYAIVDADMHNETTAAADIYPPAPGSEARYLIHTHVAASRLSKGLGLPRGGPGPAGDRGPSVPVCRPVLARRRTRLPRVLACRGALAYQEDLLLLMLPVGPERAGDRFFVFPLSLLRNGGVRATVHEVRDSARRRACRN